MNTAAKKKKLHDFIDTADDQQIIAFYNKIEGVITINSIASDSLIKIEKLELMKQASNDPLFLADMKEVMDDFDAIK
jgi:hypothetical protein